MRNSNRNDKRATVNPMGVPDDHTYTTDVRTGQARWMSPSEAEANAKLHAERSATPTLDALDDPEADV